jgi:hypothetical protein
MRGYFSTSCRYWSNESRPREVENIRAGHLVSKGD